MALHLEQFVAEVEADIKAFAAAYTEQHAADPHRYPLALEGDNAGLWMEFFMDFVMRRDQADV